MENEKETIWDKLSQPSYLTVLVVCFATVIIGLLMVITDDYGDSGGNMVIFTGFIVAIITVVIGWYRTKRPGR